MKAALADAFKKLGIEAKWIEVDASEFPPVLYGVVDGSHDGKFLREVAKAMPAPPYAHCGAVTYGGTGWVAFALDAVPESVTGAQETPRIMAHVEQVAQRAKATGP
jgi:hypothetical protein